MSSFGRRYALAIALFSSSALLLQYVLLIQATWDGIGPWLGTLRYFSFFTILSNVAVALTASVAWLGGDIAGARFFGSARVQGGTALCIAIVCAIYHFVLASTWAPQGLQLVADVALHYAVPALYVGWWTFALPHGRLHWSDPLRMLCFPAAFFGWSLLRGAWVHEYPYPFLDVDALGTSLVLRNAGAIALLFVVGGLLVVAFDRFMPQRSSAASYARAE